MIASGGYLQSPIQSIRAYHPINNLHMIIIRDYYQAWSYIHRSLTSKAAALAPQVGISS